MKDISNNSLIQSFENVLPYLSAFFDEDVSLGIADSVKYLKVINSEKLPLNAKAGDPIPQKGAAYEALKSGKVTVREVPKEVYGVPFKSYGIPIVDEKNNVIGVVLAGKSLERKNEISALSKNLSSSLQNISSAIQHISVEVQNVVDSNGEILNEVNIAKENTNGSDEILTFINGISKQTNLLGLNAAIESSRAGEAGKGFAVVAQEIRKLANSSSESVQKVDGILKKIEESVENISQKINKTNTSVETQASSLEEITASIQELSSVAQILEELSKKL